MSAMSHLPAIGVALAMVVLVEGASFAVAAMLVRLGRKPVPVRRSFLKGQSRGLRRLASGEAVRARINPILGWDYGAGTVSATK
jgi:hypothetical protein